MARVCLLLVIHIGHIKSIAVQSGILDMRAAKISVTKSAMMQRSRISGRPVTLVASIGDPGLVDDENGKQDVEVNGWMHDADALLGDSTRGFTTVRSGTSFLKHMGLQNDWSPSDIVGRTSEFKDFYEPLFLKSYQETTNDHVQSPLSYVLVPSDVLWIRQVLSNGMAAGEAASPGVNALHCDYENWQFSKTVHELNDRHLSDSDQVLSLHKHTMRQLEAGTLRHVDYFNFWMLTHHQLDWPLCHVSDKDVSQNYYKKQSYNGGTRKGSVIDKKAWNEAPLEAHCVDLDPNTGGFFFKSYGHFHFAAHLRDAPSVEPDTVVRGSIENRFAVYAANFEALYPFEKIRIEIPFSMLPLVSRLKSEAQSVIEWRCILKYEDIESIYQFRSNLYYYVAGPTSGDVIRSHAKWRDYNWITSPVQNGNRETHYLKGGFASSLDIHQTTPNLTKQLAYENTRYEILHRRHLGSIKLTPTLLRDDLVTFKSDLTKTQPNTLALQFTTDCQLASFLDVLPELLSHSNAAS